jgi:hypothetical protein
MIKEFIERFDANRESLRSVFAAKHPDSYKDIVEAVVRVVGGDSEYDSPDPARIHQIDDGDYQGTLVFVIAAGGYQPDDYWYVKVSYGSCSGCDTLQAISEYSSEPPTESQISEYMTLATHILQGLKKMGDDNRTGPFA